MKPHMDFLNRLFYRRAAAAISGFLIGIVLADTLAATYGHHLVLFAPVHDGAGSNGSATAQHAQPTSLGGDGNLLAPTAWIPTGASTIRIEPAS